MGSTKNRFATAYRFLQEHAGSGESFTIEELADVAGWARSTVLTYISKYWRPMLSEVPGGYLVAPDFSEASLARFDQDMMSRGSSARMPGMPGKRWYIASGASATASEMTLKLENWGYEVLDVGHSLRSGVTLHAGILAAIRSADGVIGISEAPPFSANVAFELGAAVALSKPIALLTGRSVEIPSNLAGCLNVRLDTVSADSLDFLLERLAGARAHQRVLHSGTSGTLTPLGEQAADLKRRLGACSA